MNKENMVLNNITKADIKWMPEYFNRYINLVEDDYLNDAFKNSITNLWVLDLDKLTKLHSKTYAEGKWTVNAILQHLVDVERILCARTLLFARDAEQAIPIDVDKLAANANADLKPVEHIIEELITVRKGTYALYRTFEYNDFIKSGINGKHRISVVAMGYNIIGHQLHHLKVIRDQYFSLV
jgi:hypothetical protein